MVTYNCERCGYSSNNKSYFKKHLLRKIPCQAIIKDIPISEIYDKIYGVNSYNTIKFIVKSNTKKDITKIRSNTPKYAGTLQEYAENTLKYAQIRSEPKLQIVCKNCGKTFK